MTFRYPAPWGGGGFILLAASLCIDTGIAFFVLNGDTLVDMNPDQYFGTAPDVGAFEFDDGSGFEGSAGPFQNGIGSYQNSPNPFSWGTVITYQLFAESFVSIEVYDLFGRSVMMLVEAAQAAGSSLLYGMEEVIPAGGFLPGHISQGCRQTAIREA